MQRQSRQTDSSQQGCGKLCCLPFGIEGNESELSVSIMPCGLRCCFDFLRNDVTFCAIIRGYKLSMRNFVLFVNFCTDPLNVSSESSLEVIVDSQMAGLMMRIIMSWR